MAKPDAELELWVVPAIMQIDQRKARKAFKRHFKKAMRRMGPPTTRLFRRQYGKVPPPNSILTMAFKNRNTPLQDDGLLKKNTVWKAGQTSDTEYELRVGVFETASPTSRGLGLPQLAKLHVRGTIITVTPKMAALFQALSMATRGEPVHLRSARAQELYQKAKGPIPALEAGDTLLVPGRPINRQVFQDSSWRRDVVQKETKKAAIDMLQELFPDKPLTRVR